MRQNSVVTDTTHGVIHFPHPTTPAKNAALEKSTKPQLVLFQDNTAVPPMTTKTITALVDHPSEWHTTGTVTPLGKVYRSSESVNISLNFNANEQKGSIQNHQHNGITISNQEKHKS